jgi:hypothetical protein
MTSLSAALKDRLPGFCFPVSETTVWPGIGAIAQGGGNAIVQDPNTCLCSDTTALTAEQYGLSCRPARGLPWLRRSTPIAWDTSQ